MRERANKPFLLFFTSSYNSQLSYIEFRKLIGNQKIIEILYFIVDYDIFDLGKMERGFFMKKKVIKCALLVVFIIIIALGIINTYKWIVCGRQDIKINTSKKAYTNSDLYVSIVAQEKGVDLETKTKIKLLNSDKKKVKGAVVSYDENTAKISIQEIKAGKYFIEAKVSSKAGKDTIQKEIYITDNNQENVTVTLDKGIYKPRRYCKF